MLKITLNSPWFELVRSGQKLYEGRRALEKIKQIKVDDIIEISHHTDSSVIPYLVSITSIHHFPTFELALQTLPIGEILPVDGITVETGVEIYKKYVSIPTQLADGIIMLGIKKLNE